MAQSNSRILVVEDESVVAEDLKGCLIDLGYNVVASASSGEEAFTQAAERRPDLVLMDIKLKGDLDGVGASEQIHNRLNIPVIYITASSDNETLQRAKRTEPYGYLLKPFEDGQLQTTIELALYKHEMERKLEESNLWLVTILKSIGDAVIVTDNRGHIKFINAIAEGLTGWNQQDALGRNAAEVFSLEPIPKVGVSDFQIAVNRSAAGGEMPPTPSAEISPTAFCEDPVMKALQEGVAVGLADHTISNARGRTKIPIIGSAAPLKDSKGNVTGAVLAFHDITDRKRAEEQLKKIHGDLEEKMKELEQKNKEIEHFIFAVAHDLKSPLISIQGFITELDKALKEENFCLSRVQANAKQLEEIIYDLMELSRVGRVDTTLEDVDLDDVLKETLERLEHQIKEKKIELKVQDGFPVVSSNQHRLDQVLTNLIVNAISYMGDQKNPCIEAGFQEEEKSWVVYVKDNGVGIPEQSQQNIFEIFERLPEAKKLEPKGTGIGLAIVKKIIESLGGRVWVESKVGVGSTFYFTVAKALNH